MRRFVVFAATCASLDPRGSDRGRPRDIQYFQTQIAAVGRRWRDGAYREHPGARRLFQSNAAPDPDAFFDALFLEAERRAGGGTPLVLLHIHGFASTPRSAAERAGEITDKYFAGRTSQRPAALSFIWPSRGVTIDWTSRASGPAGAYRRDRLIAARSAPRLVQLLRALAQARSRRDRKPRLVLLAHSMGAWVVEKAAPLLKGAILGELGPAPLFDLAFLMAADCRAAALEPGGDLSALGRLSASTQVFFAPDKDTAVFASPIFSDGAQRLGHIGPSRRARETVSGLGSVNCDDVAITVGNDFNHQYYRLGREVVDEANVAMRSAAAGTARRDRRLRGERTLSARYSNFHRRNRRGYG